MKSVLSRCYRPNETTGRLIVFDQDNKVLELVTLELSDRNNQKEFSCIPEGIYPIKKIISPTKGKCFLVENVLGRDNIEIHIGNYATGQRIDTKGCILPGLKFMDINQDGNLDVSNSTLAMRRLLNILPNESTLIII